jgi:ABC-type multidrug transport system permease subunit
MRVKSQFFQTLVFGLIISSIWWQLSSSQAGIQDRSGVLFFMSANGMMSSLMGVLSTFANERAAFIRDYENNLYNAGSYFSAKVATDVPFYCIFPLIATSITYFSVGFQLDFTKYVNACILVILLNLCGLSYGLIIACTFEDIAVSLLIAPLIIMPLMMFCGFFLNTDSIPPYFIWVEWISPMKYAFAGLAQNEYTGLTLHCNPSELIQVGDSTPICPFLEGEDFLETYNIQSFLTIGMCQIMLVGLTTMAFLGAFAALCRLVRKDTSRGS